jgi:hypothetical protein
MRVHRLCRSLGALCALLVTAGAGANATASVRVQEDGALQIAGRRLQCGSARNVVDPWLPNLGMAGPGVLILNPALLDRYPDSVRLFVFHHECGHHHVGSDEIEADCWAVNRGLRDGWLAERDLAPICRSFGPDRGTESHPFVTSRCASLRRCFKASQDYQRSDRLALGSQASSSEARRRLPLVLAHAPHVRDQAAPRRPARMDNSSAPVGLAGLIFVALIWAAIPRRRASSRQAAAQPTSAR